MPLLRSIFQAPPADGDDRALQLLLAYWDPASPHSLADAIQHCSLLITQLLPQPLRTLIAAQLGLHIVGDVQNLLLGDLAAVQAGHQYGGWVVAAADAMVSDDEGRAAELLQLVGQTFNASIWRLRLAHGVLP